MPIEAHSMLEVVEGWRVHTYDFARDDVPRLVVILLLATLFIRILRMISTRLVLFSKTGALPSGVRSQQLRTLASVIHSVGIFVISFIALLELLELFQINIGPLLASAGIAGLAIGFGAQTLVKDVINGFFILLENQFDVGDVVNGGRIRRRGVAYPAPHRTARWGRHARTPYPTARSRLSPT